MAIVGKINGVPIEFSESAISHLNISDIGSNTHVQIDTHIADATLHYTQASITTVGTIATGVWNGTPITGTYIDESTVDHDLLLNFDAAEHFTQASITTVGTISTGTWNGSVIAEAYGGTNQSTYATGDILYATGANTLGKLTAGTDTHVLTLSGGVPTWAASAGGALSITQVSLADADQTLSATDMVDNKMFSITPTTTRTLTTDTAANIISQFGSTVGEYFDFTIIDLNVTNDLTLAAGSGVTLVGHMTIRASSGTFRCRVDSGSAVTIYALDKHDIQPSEITSGMISSSAVTTGKINNDAVTYAKIQNVVADQVLLGNDNGAGSEVQELTAAEVKTILALSNVEDTALSTWAGTSNITTLGTIATGTWQGTAIAEVYGGTNQTTYATGDILYASASNTLTKLAAGTNGHVLTLAAGVPSWAAGGGGGGSQTVDINIASIVSSGTTSRAYTFVSNELVWEAAGGGNNQTFNAYTTFVVPEDYSSGGDLNIFTRRSGAVDSCIVSAYVEDAIDSTINAVNILPGSDITWTETNTTFGSTLAAGDIINLDISGVCDNNEDLQFKALTFTYTA
jgi:hypothetical protein